MGAETYSEGGTTWHRIQAALSRFRTLQYDNSGNRNDRAHDRPGREEEVWLPASAVGGSFADSRGLEEQERWGESRAPSSRFSTRLRCHKAAGGQQAG